MSSRIGPTIGTGARSKAFLIANHDILRQDGVPAVSLYNATGSIVQTETKTLFVLDFNRKNHWQSGEGGQPIRGTFAVTGFDRSGNGYLLGYYQTATLMNGGCYYTRNDRQFAHRSDPSIFDRTVDMVFVSTPTSGKMGKC